MTTVSRPLHPVLIFVPLAMLAGSLLAISYMSFELTENVTQLYVRTGIGASLYAFVAGQFLLRDVLTGFKTTKLAVLFSAFIAVPVAMGFLIGSPNGIFVLLPWLLTLTFIAVYLVALGVQIAFARMLSRE